VYSGSKQNVRMTMVAGRVLYQDGQFYLGTSKEEIYAKANESARRILGV
jgi:5-methylthioadenosine/S-adenosylhomocysteine deaminase